jgi:hypothetical protein
MLWISFSRSMHLRCIALRLGSSARVYRLSRLFTCTRLYQPQRRIWSMPRASFRLVLLRIADSAALIYRASMQTISQPATVRPAARC